MTTILEEIREGMTVCDPSGAEIGTVEFIHLSDEAPSMAGPQPATVSPSTGEQRRTLVDFVADAF